MSAVFSAGTFQRPKLCQRSDNRFNRLSLISPTRWGASHIHCRAWQSPPFFLRVQTMIVRKRNESISELGFLSDSIKVTKNHTQRQTRSHSPKCLQLLSWSQMAQKRWNCTLFEKITFIHLIQVLNVTLKHHHIWHPSTSRRGHYLCICPRSAQC